MFAVVEINNKQHLVKEGNVLTIDGNYEENTLSFTKLLLIQHENNAVSIGQPYLDGGAIEAIVLESGKREKDIVFKFKRKTGYKLTKGHRQNSTTIKITKISAPKQSKQISTTADTETNNTKPKTESKAKTDTKTKSETKAKTESKQKGAANNTKEGNTNSETSGNK